VAAIGPEVTQLRVGDHVVGSLTQACGVCARCLSGRPFQCSHPDATVRGSTESPRLSRRGAPLYQGFGLGGFAERVLVHENQLVVVPETLPFPQAALTDSDFEPSESSTTEESSMSTSAPVRVTKVTFPNQLNSTAGLLFTPPNFEKTKKYPAMPVAHPFGGVKEQTAGIYARKMAEKGYVTLAFDASHQGESGGYPRDTENPADRTSSGPRTFTPWSLGRNRTSATACCAGSTRRFGSCSPTRWSGRTTWLGSWSMPPCTEHRSATLPSSRTETSEP